MNIRHEGAKRIIVIGKDPQRAADDSALNFSGAWREEADAAWERRRPAGAFRISAPQLAGETPALPDPCHVTDSADATVTAQYDGNQVRFIGRANPSGGLADVFLDGEKQLVPIDCWNPTPRSQQVLYYRNGLAAGPHTVRMLIACRLRLSTGTIVLFRMSDMNVMRDA